MTTTPQVDLEEARKLADALLEDEFEAEAYPFKQSAAALRALADEVEALRSMYDSLTSQLAEANEDCYELTKQLEAEKPQKSDRAAIAEQKT